MKKKKECVLAKGNGMRKKTEVKIKSLLSKECHVKFSNYGWSSEWAEKWKLPNEDSRTHTYRIQTFS